MSNPNKCQNCGKEYKPKRITQKYCNRYCTNKAQSKPKKTFKCKNCENLFKEKWNSNNIYCSISCSKEYKSNNKKPYTKKIKTSCKLYYNTCEECNKIFIDKRKIKHCSNECRNKQYKRNKKNKYIKKEYEDNNCKLCGNKFKPSTANNLYCSSECNKEVIKSYQRDKEHKRRMRIKSSYDKGTTLYNIRLRDGDRCLMCNKKVLEKNISGYDKANATIGHIIALCNGGEHTMRNVQLECQECNTKKGGRNKGQLRLW